MRYAYRYALEELFKKASFECPLGRNPKNCDGHACPSRDEKPFDDYYNEYVDSLYARMELRYRKYGREG